MQTTTERELRKAERKYPKAIAKYENAPPLSERVKATRKETKGVELLTRLKEKTLSIKTDSTGQSEKDN